MKAIKSFTLGIVMSISLTVIFFGILGLIPLQHLTHKGQSVVFVYCSSIVFMDIAYLICGVLTFVFSFLKLKSLW